MVGVTFSLMTRVTDASGGVGWGLDRLRKKLDPEGGGGFNPRIKPTESASALAAEGRFPQISSKIPGFSAAS
jgi:hypothetical protein